MAELSDRPARALPGEVHVATGTPAAAVKPFGITTGQVWAKGLDGQATNRNGVERADLIRATQNS